MGLQSHHKQSHLPLKSNGLVEKSVHIAKQLLKKSKSDDGEPYLGLLEHRNTPLDDMAVPAQALDEQKSTLCTSDYMYMYCTCIVVKYKPNMVDPELAREKMEQK